MDLKSGDVKEIIKLKDLKESDLGEDIKMSINDLIWDESGTSLMFSIKYSVIKEETIKINEERKKLFETDKDEVTIGITQAVKNNTYIITFDR